MRRAFLFCPENDIALGRDCRRFTPPRQAALLARYGAPLMWWLGDESDYVVVPEPADEGYARMLMQWECEMSARFGAGPRIVTSLADAEVDLLCPWGWSGYAGQLFCDAGADAAVLQRSMPRIGTVRELSHRRSATLVNEALARDVDWASFGQSAPVGAVEATDIGVVKELIAGGRAFYAKSPWSSSGRGVVCSEGVADVRMLERCGAVIRDQGSVMIEPAYDKVIDFAMLFECHCGGEVRFHGYSRFYNSRATAYSGNMLASDAEIAACLHDFIDADLLEHVSSALESILTKLLDGEWRGFLGVDMLVARSSAGSFFLVPCVELNLRMTMGVVAHAVWNRCRLRGVMDIEPGGNGLLLPGEVALVPANPYFVIKCKQNRWD